MATDVRKTAPAAKRVEGWLVALVALVAFGCTSRAPCGSRKCLHGEVCVLVTRVLEAPSPARDAGVLDAGFPGTCEPIPKPCKGELGKAYCDCICRPGSPTFCDPAKQRVACIGK